jgi:hypothetical protein
MPKNQGTIYSIGWANVDARNVFSLVIDLPDGVSPPMTNTPVEIVPTGEIASLRQQLAAERERLEKAEIAIKPFATILDHITSEIDPKSMWRIRQDQEDADFTGREVLAAKAILSAPAQKENEKSE